MLSGPIKTLESIQRKLKADSAEQGREVKIEELKDIVRCSFIFETREQIEVALQQLHSLMNIVRAKNRTKNAGYKDVLLNVQYEGVIVEVQLHTAAGLAAKDGDMIPHASVQAQNAKLGSLAGNGHRLYDLERTAKGVHKGILSALSVAFYEMCEVLTL